MTTKYTTKLDGKTIEIDPINDLPAGLSVTKLYHSSVAGRPDRWVTIIGDSSYITTGGEIAHDAQNEIY